MLRPKPEDLAGPAVTAELRLFFLPRLAPAGISHLRLLVATASWQPERGGVAPQAASLTDFEVGGVPPTVDVELGSTPEDLVDRSPSEVERELVAVAARCDALRP